MESHTIREALQTRSIRQAAKHLGTSFSNLRYWMRKHGIVVVKSTCPCSRSCCNCGESKPDRFYRAYNLCKTCFNRYCIQRWIRRKLDAIAYKGGRCQRCSYDRHYAALEFHHRDPSAKDVQWSKLRLRSWKAILAELDKCDLLCANCHREVHA